MYHVTEQGPRVCKATMGQCPYAKGENSHFAEQTDAYNAYEQKLTKQYGAMGTSVARKVNQTPLQKRYRQLDQLEKTSPVYKAFADRQRLRRYTPTRRNTRPSNTRSNRGGYRGGSRGGSRPLNRAMRRSSSRILRKHTRKFRRAITPNARNIKKMLLVKYWMPDIHSKKWR